MIRGSLKKLSTNALEERNSEAAFPFAPTSETGPFPKDSRLREFSLRPDVRLGTRCMKTPTESGFRGPQRWPIPEKREAAKPSLLFDHTQSLVNVSASSL